MGPGDGPPADRHDGAPVKLLLRRAWIFDLDGTLTVAAHDFDAIRAQLGLQPTAPILEQLAAMSAAEADPLLRRLAGIEREIADQARAQSGASALLEGLRRRGKRLGIVTRNRKDLALRTLAAAGLEGFFEAADVLGRDDAAPKPSPAALLVLLGRWGLGGDQAVMVGDFLFDLQAGRAAGAAAVHFDTSGRFPWTEHCDRQVDRLDALLEDR